MTFKKTLCYRPALPADAVRVYPPSQEGHVAMSDAGRRLSAPRSAVCLALLILTGCATQQRVVRLEGDLSTLKTQVEELQKSGETTARELARTAGELRELEGGLLHRAREGRAIAQQVTRIEARVEQTEPLLRELRSAVDALAQQVARLTPPASRSERPRAQRTEPAEQLYSTALRSFQAGELGQAVLEFLEFIARFPTHPQAGHAQFWIAEVYYAQRDYRQALPEFQKAAEQYPKSDKTPEALFRMGVCYRALRDPHRARDVWQQLVQDHSGSDAARRARVLLRDRPISTRRQR